MDTVALVTTKVTKSHCVGSMTMARSKLDNCEYPCFAIIVKVKVKQIMKYNIACKVLEIANFVWIPAVCITGGPM